MMEKQNKVKKAQLKAAGERKHERMVAKQRAHKDHEKMEKALKGQRQGKQIKNI